MSSLQEQLLKAGVADKKKLKKIKHEQRQQKAQQPKGQAKGQPRLSAAQLAAQEAAEQANAEKVARDRALNKERQAAAETKALRAQVAQMIAVNRIDDGKGDTPYQFSDGQQIHKLYVTKQQHQALSQGQLAVAKSNKSYSVIPAKAAEKIQQREAAAIVSLHERKQQLAADDDPYADYEIPDDFDW